MGRASTLYMCSACKGKLEFENVRYSNDGKRIVCKDCYSRVGKSQKKETKVMPQKDSLPDSIKLICIKCRYKFSLKRKPEIRVICPYCGGNQLMKDDITADKLIKEVSQNSNLYQ